MENKQNELGVLWKGKSDKVAFSGVIEIDGVKKNVVVFENKYKKEDKHPDYRILESIPRDQAAPKPEDNPFN